MGALWARYDSDICSRMAFFTFTWIKAQERYRRVTDALQTRYKHLTAATSAHGWRSSRSPGERHGTKRYRSVMDALPERYGRVTDALRQRHLPTDGVLHVHLDKRHRSVTGALRMRYRRVTDALRMRYRLAVCALQTRYGE
ncbi:hypothetical protein Bbelb_108870 [Branchiostoma belcheri]|nr:hypothetical protein Bbelb_108870 [Branchiostoma belcheri]